MKQTAKRNKNSTNPDQMHLRTRDANRIFQFITFTNVLVDAKIGMYLSGIFTS